MKECSHAQTLGLANSASDVHSLKFHVDIGGWMYKNIIKMRDILTDGQLNKIHNFYLRVFWLVRVKPVA